MADIKTSQNEEEYFHKQEQERLARRREEASKQKAARDKDERRASHYMKCPKCGGDLKEEQYHRVQIDRCADCKGIWFDAGEAEGLLDHAPGAVQGFFGDLLKGMGGGKKK